MPGHLGGISTIWSSSKLIEATSALRYFDFHQRKNTLDQGDIFQTLVKDEREASEGYFEQEGKKMWLDGEVFSSTSITEFADGGKLKGVRGQFSAIIYDKKASNFSLSTDRFGLKPLYLYQGHGHIIWSSEIKVFGQLGLSLTYDQKAIQAYLELGYLPGHLTWYKEVDLLPPAAQWTLDIKTRSVHKKVYWTWDDIPVQSMSFDHAVERTVGLLHQAMERRCKDREGLTLALSGGLDSRTLLALGKDQIQTTFTFGLESGDDAVLAKRCAEALGKGYNMLVIDKDNWLEDRQSSVWRTEGMMPFFELHSAPLIQGFPSLGKAVLNGFGGANYLGGLYDEREKLVKELRPFIQLETYDHPHLGQSPHILDHHMRRKVLQGSIDVGKALVQIKPFMDEDLLDHVLGLPISYRRNYRLFFALIDKIYPQSLKQIPWETTGWPLYHTGLQRMSLRLKWPSIKRRMGMKSGVFDYQKWARQPLFIEMAKGLIDDNQELHDLIGRKAGFDPSSLEKSGALLSLAIWMQGKPQTP